MKVETSFIENVDRYFFDCGECTFEKGYAQVNTPVDASYYGIWCNPSTLHIVEFVEGDVNNTYCDTSTEFTQKLHEVSERFSNTHGKTFRIDAGLRTQLVSSFVQLGLAALLH